MRSTRRLRNRLALGALAVGACGGLGGSALSCSDDSDDSRPTVDGAAPDVAIAVDASTPDTSVVPHDAQTSDASPRPVSCDAAGTCATALTVSNVANGATFCALLSDSTVACWGQNSASELGRGEEARGHDSAIAARVSGLADIASIGRNCAVDRSGSAYCWGFGPWLQDPTQNGTLASLPVKLPLPKVTAIDSFVRYDISLACALTTTGASCWGQNTNAQVSAPEAGVDPTQPLPASTIALGSTTAALSIAVGDATFVRHADGTISSWGASPPLGRIASLFPDPYPGPLTLAGATSVAVEGAAACVTAQGIAYCWGAQSFSDPTPVMLPTPILTPEPVIQIANTASGGSLDPPRSCMIGISGDVYCYGSNISGQVGDGTKDYAITPTKVVGLPAPAAHLETTNRTTCALLVNGKVFCWGDDEFGQLGVGKIQSPRSTPGEVPLP